MADLVTAPNLARPDDFYERLIAAHRGLDPEAIAADVAREGGPPMGCGLEIMTSFDPKPITWD